MEGSATRCTDESPLCRVSTRVREEVLSSVVDRPSVLSRGSCVKDGASTDRMPEVSAPDCVGPPSKAVSPVCDDSGVAVRSRVEVRTIGRRVTEAPRPESSSEERARTVALPGSTVRTPASSGARLRPPRTEVPRDVSWRESSGLTSLISRVAVLVRMLPTSASPAPGANAPSALRVEARCSTPDSIPPRTARLLMAGTSRTSSRSSDTLRNWAVRAEVATAVRTERACSRAMGCAR